MLDKVKEFVSAASYLGPQDMAAMIQLVSIRCFKTGEVLLRVDDLNHNMYVVLKGLLRSHVIKTNGEERTVYLASEGMITGSSRTFVTGSASLETVSAIEDTWVAVADRRRFEELADERPGVQKFYLDQMKKTLFEAVTRLEFHTVMSPMERYQGLMKERPALVQRVPQIYLASYLGVTPVSLSRIRARIASEKKQ
ncbi:MAG: cyclic nucleotide-binding domain-containing protein [Flavobacteriales bacterium]|nr:cyclic nucleotide-binding domain-containing protein [Flavobacteriales bacterium]